MPKSRMLQLWLGRSLARAQGTKINPLVRRYLTDVTTAVANYDLAVVYGSYSGTTQHLATQLAAELRWRLGLNPLLGACNEWEWNRISELRKPLLVLMTTYGPGGPANNATLFWDAVVEPPLSSAPRLLMPFSVFGRGNSIYDTFNRAGRRVYSRLIELGAKSLAPYGEQDKLSEAGAEEDAYFGWKEEVVASLSRQFGKTESPYIFHPSTAVVAGASPSPLSSSTLPDLPLCMAGSEAPIMSKATTTKLAETERMYIEAQVEVPGYQTGDHLALWPTNSSQEVEIFLSAVGADCRPMQIDNRYRTTWRALAERHVDINARVTRSLLWQISEFAPSEHVRECAVKLSADAPEFQRVISSEFNLGRLLLSLSGGEAWSVPMSFVLDVLPRLQARQFSITSAASESPNVASIAAVVEAHGELKGVATSFLQHEIENKNFELPAAVLPSSFHLPESPDVPLIMVGLGTGIAPFRAFVRQHKGPMLLFAGCRTREDFLFRSEFEGIELVECFSREQGMRKKHVQTGILEHASRVWELLQAGATIYVCGDIRKVRHDVRSAWIQIIADCGGFSKEEAKRWYKQLKRSGRIKNDLW